MTREVKYPDGGVIAAKARELLKPRVPFRPYGRTTARGMDCIGVVMWTAFELGIWPTFKLPKYSFPPQPELFDEIFPQFTDEVKVEDIQQGDIVVIRNEQNRPHHVGIVVLSRIDSHFRLVGIGLGEPLMFVAEFNYTAALVARTYKVFRYVYVV